MKKHLLALILAVACTAALVLSPGAAQSGPKTKAYVYANISDFRRDTPKEDTAVVQLEGYYTPGDGGGGTFIWDVTSTAVPNGGTVFSPGGGRDGRYLRVCDPTDLSVIWFGGGGTGEDSGAIQAAIDALPESGGTVRVPGGKYKIQSPIVIGDGGTRKSVKLIGAGNGHGHEMTMETVFQCSSGMDAVITVNGPITDCEISGIRINAESLANYAIRIKGMSNSRVTNVSGSGGKIATWLIESADGEDGATSNVLFRGCGGFPIKPSSTVLIVDGGESGNPVRNCTFEICRFDAAKQENSTSTVIGLAEKNTFRRCHLVFTHGTKGSRGLVLDPTGHDGYPKQNAFYDGSIASVTVGVSEDGEETGYNYAFGHGSWDNETFTPSPKFFGLTDLGVIIRYDGE